MRGSIRVVVVGIALALVAAACSSNSSSGGVRQTARASRAEPSRSYNGEPNHLIPQNDYESAGTQAFQGLWTRLVDFDPTTFKPVPAQADSIDVSSDGLTYTIKIKPGWTFHDGTPGDRAVLRRRVELRGVRPERVHPELLLRQDRRLRRPQPVERQHLKTQGAVRAEGEQRHAVQRDAHRRRSASSSTRSGSTPSTRCRRRSSTTRRLRRAADRRRAVHDGRQVAARSVDQPAALPRLRGNPRIRRQHRAAHLSGRRRVARLPGGQPRHHARRVRPPERSPADLRRTRCRRSPGLDAPVPRTCRCTTRAVPEQASSARRCRWRSTARR